MADAYFPTSAGNQTRHWLDLQQPEAQQVFIMSMRVAHTYYWRQGACEVHRHEAISNGGHLSPLS
jgi:hypothetical protein